MLLHASDNKHESIHAPRLGSSPGELRKYTSFAPSHSLSDVTTAVGPALGRKEVLVAVVVVVGLGWFVVCVCVCVCVSVCVCVFQRQ